MATLYEHIQTLCKERGVRPGKLCADLGLSRSLMTDLKMGRKKSIRTETAQKIAAYLNVTLEQLMTLGQSSGDTVRLEDVDVAFYGDFKELSDDDKETVRDMVRLMRQRRAAKQRE